jgi:hypothetical protein
MRKIMQAAVLRAVLALVAVCFVAPAPTYAQQRPARGILFDIPAQNTAYALQDFAQQAHVQLMFPYDVARRTNSPALEGRYSVEAAVARLIAGTQLRIAYIRDGTVALRGAGAGGGRPMQTRGQNGTPREADRGEAVIVEINAAPAG